MLVEQENIVMEDLVPSRVVITVEEVELQKPQVSVIQQQVVEEQQICV